jgi:hypothetical protein
LGRAGYIDDVALYDHVLPVTTVEAHYERGKRQP